jgi:hypothetical protein
MKRGVTWKSPNDVCRELPLAPRLEATKGTSQRSSKRRLSGE